MQKKRTESYSIHKKRGMDPHFASLMTVLKVCTNAGRISGGVSANWLSTGGCI